MVFRKMDLKQVVGKEIFRRAGLAKLDPEERTVLADWIQDRVQKAIRHTVKDLAQKGPMGKPPWPTGK